MPKEKIDVSHCAECGCDRSGVIDLEEKRPVLRCFECNKDREDQRGKQNRRE